MGESIDQFLSPMDRSGYMTKIIGLTGGMGSGKSTVSGFFSQMGVPIIDADQIAHRLVQKDTSCYTQIVTHFGALILNPDKSLNRSLLKEIIFNDPLQKKWLEELLHPRIHDEIVSQISLVKFSYCIVVIPLLVETFDQYKSILDRILVIEVPGDTQIERLVNRDKAHADLLHKIITAQATSDMRLDIADDILYNNEDEATLLVKVKALHLKYLQFS